MRLGDGWTRGAAALRVAAALAAGLIPHLLLFNAGTFESDPPICVSVFDYVVPCGNLSLAAGSITACVVAALLFRFAAPRSVTRR